MTKWNWVTIFAAIVAGLAILAGVCFYFFGARTITDVPSSIEIQQIEGEYYAVATYNAKYLYEFKIEQTIDGKPTEIYREKISSNSLKLADTDMTIVPGQEYRFSACYATENGAGNGKFCTPYVWHPEGILEQVTGLEYNSTENKITWNEVYRADGYDVIFKDNKTGLAVEEDVGNETTYFLGNTGVGNYTVYVVGYSNNQNILSSSVGEGIAIKITKRNQIVSVSRDAAIEIICTQEVEAFEIKVNGDILVERIEPDYSFKSGNNIIYYIYHNAGTGKIIFADVDFERDNVTITALATEFILQSNEATIR